MARRRHAKRRRRRSVQADPDQGATTSCAGPPERGGPGGSRAERLTQSGDAFSLGARVSNLRPKWGWEAAAGFDWMPGWGSGISAANSATVQRKKLRHSKAGFGAPSTTIITPAGGTTLVVAKSNNEKIRDASATPRKQHFRPQ